MKLEDSKKVYDSIEIPEELDFIVKKAIASKNKEEIRKKRRMMIMKKTYRGFAAAAAGIVVCTTIGLNTSQTISEDMAKMPVIGGIAKVLTIRSYHTEDDSYKIDLEVPKVEVNQNGQNSETELTEKVNAKIQKIVNDYTEAAKKEFEDYKEAFFATGGTEEDWNGRTMDIGVNYNIKSQKGNILSLELITSKGWVNAEEEHHYYNLDLSEDKVLSLEDVLGSDYISIANESIQQQIQDRIKKDDSLAYFGYGPNAEDDMIEGFKTITKDTLFYINDSNHVVIVFPEYSIAPGYMGWQEFEIDSPINLPSPAAETK